MPNGVSKTQALKLIASAAGREEVRERLVARDDLSDADIRLVNAALSSQDPSEFIAKKQNFTGFLERLFREGVTPKGENPRIFSKHLSSPDVGYLRIYKDDVESFSRDLPNAMAISNVDHVEFLIKGMKVFGIELVEEMMKFARRYDREFNTILYALTSPKPRESGGDIFLLNLSRLDEYHFYVLGQEWEGRTTFFAQGPRATDAIRELRNLDINALAEASETNGGGGSNSGSSAPSGGSGGAAPNASGPGGAHAMQGGAMRMDTAHDADESEGDDRHQALGYDHHSTFWNPGPGGAGAALMFLPIKPFTPIR